MKKILIIRNSSTKIKIYSNYMIVTSNQEHNIIAFRHIKELYINKAILLSPSHFLKMASFFSLYFIDHNGYVLATIRLEDDKA